MSAGHPDWNLPPYRPPLERYKTDLGIGIIGFGRIVHAFHMPAYRQAGYRVAAAADPAEAAREQAKAWGIAPVFADYRDLLALDEVRVIDLAVSHQNDDARLEIIRAAAQAGKHVVVHKPIARTLPVAEAMVEAAEKGGIQLAVNQNARYGPANYSIKQLLCPQRLGQAGVLEVENMVRGPAQPMGFNARGADLAWSIHHADLLRWWADSEPDRVYAQFAQGASMILYRFASGASAYHLEITSNSVDCETAIRIWAEKGSIRGNHRWNPWNNWAREAVEFRSVEWPGAVEGLSLRLPGDPGNPYGKPSRFDSSAPLAGFIGIMGDFMQAVEEGRPSPTNARDNLLSLRMCLAAQRSAELGQPVDPRSF